MKTDTNFAPLYIVIGLIAFAMVMLTVCIKAQHDTIVVQGQALAQAQAEVERLNTFELTDPDDQCNDDSTPEYVQQSPACTGVADDSETEQPALHSAALR